MAEVKVSKRVSPSPAQILSEKPSFLVGRKPRKKPEGRLSESGVKSKCHMHWDLLEMSSFEGRDQCPR